MSVFLLIWLNQCQLVLVSGRLMMPPPTALHADKLYGKSMSHGMGLIPFGFYEMMLMVASGSRDVLWCMSPRRGVVGHWGRR